MTSVQISKTRPPFEKIGVKCVCSMHWTFFVGTISGSGELRVYPCRGILTLWGADWPFLCFLFLWMTNFKKRRCICRGWGLGVGWGGEGRGRGVECLVQRFRNMEWLELRFGLWFYKPTGPQDVYWTKAFYSCPPFSPGLCRGLCWRPQLICLMVRGIVRNDSFNLILGV